MFRRHAKQETLTSQFQEKIALQLPGQPPLFDLSPEAIARYRWLHTYFTRNRGAMPYLLGVTSAVQGEGVTYIASRMAAVMAMDLQVPLVIVETGFAAPRLSDYLQASAAPGLAEVVNGQVPLESALRETTIPNLQLLLSGDVPEHPSSLLRCPAMMQTLEDLKQRFAYVLLDLPAVLYTSDGVVLSQQCDGVLWVVRAGVTPIGAVQRGLAMVDRNKITGVALNGSRLHTPRPLLRLFGL